MVDRTKDRSLPEVYTVKEVAKALKVSERKVWSLLAEGKLRAFRVEGHVRIRREDYERYLTSEPYRRITEHRDESF